ncbi:MAG: type II and III secretion system protein [Candidatus Hydrogenedentes bacterium]|nr:type II and III secretion system protein [Candidatus Hydrogenedentota bacterium]
MILKRHIAVIALSFTSAFAQDAPALAAPAAETPAVAAPAAEAPAVAAPAAEAPAVVAPVPPPADPAAPAVPAPAPPPPLTDIRQVQIQVWISQTDEDGLREIGSNINYTRFVRGREQSGSLERVRTETFNPSGTTFQTTLPAPDSNTYPDNVRLTPESDTPWTPGNTLVNDLGRPGEVQINAHRGAGLTYDIIDTDRGTIDGILRGIETKADSDLISRPELLVMNNAIAEIRAGDEIPFQSVTYTSTTPSLKITWRSLGVNIYLQPTILTPDLVQINIPNLEVSDRLKDTPIQGLQIPVFSSRRQTGTVIVPNAQTLVIGGLSTRAIRKTEKRVPIIGRLPVLGIPFRGRSNEATTSQLLVFISPTIVDLRAMKPEMESALNFWQGNEWQNIDEMSQEVELMDEDL